MHFPFVIALITIFTPVVNAACSSTTDATKTNLLNILTQFDIFNIQRVKSESYTAYTENSAAIRTVRTAVSKLSTTDACASGNVTEYNTWLNEAKKIITYKMGMSNYADIVSNFLEKGVDLISTIDDSTVQTAAATLKAKWSDETNSMAFSNMAENDCDTLYNVIGDVQAFLMSIMRRTKKFKYIGSIAQDILLWKKLLAQVTVVPEMLQQQCYNASDETALGSLAMQLRNNLLTDNTMLDEMSDADVDTLMTQVGALGAQVFQALIVQLSTALETDVTDLLVGINYLCSDGNCDIGNESSESSVSSESTDDDGDDEATTAVADELLATLIPFADLDYTQMSVDELETLKTQASAQLENVLNKLVEYEGDGDEDKVTEMQDLMVTIGEQQAQMDVELDSRD